MYKKSFLRRGISTKNSETENVIILIIAKKK